MAQSTDEPRFIYIDILSGVEGPCLTVGNNHGGRRLDGPKPWGGGKIIQRWIVNVAELYEAVERDKMHRDELKTLRMLAAQRDKE